MQNQDRARPIILACLLAALTVIPVKAALSQTDAAIPATVADSQDKVADPDKLREESRLQRLITISAVGMPLREALDALAKDSGVTLEATRSIAEQRVTLCVNDQPMWQVMAHLTGLLDHSPTSSKGYYYWEKQKGAAAQQPAFKLLRGNGALANERNALEFPQREMTRILKETRDFAKMTKEQRAAYHGDGVLTSRDYQKIQDALRYLSDTQIAALVTGEKIYLAPSRYADQIALFHSNTSADQQGDVRNDDASKVPVPALPPPTIALIPQGIDEETSGWRGRFGIEVIGISTKKGEVVSAMPIIDPYRWNAQNQEATLKQLESEPGPRLDLATALFKGIEDETDSSEGRRRRRDLGELLRAFGATTNTNIYEEHFIKNAPVSIYAPYPGLASLTGTRGQLIASISRDFNVRLEKIGEDYYVWSNTWALDRQGDIPEPDLDFWRQQDKAHGGFTLRDRAQFAHMYSLVQLRQTFQQVIPSWGDSVRSDDFVVLQALGNLTKDQWNILANGKSLSFSELSPDFARTLAVRYTDLATKRGPLRLMVSCPEANQFQEKSCALFRLSVISDAPIDNTYDMSNRTGAPAKAGVLMYTHSFEQ